MQKRTGSVNRVGQKRIYTVYDHMYGDFPAKDTVYTPYIHINVWFWPTPNMNNLAEQHTHQLASHLCHALIESQLAITIK